jgi:DNA-directed RNA polymerase specialized sigma subunit|tara:strand:+ start:1221 stop:1829 length:609 start_codon:yes stop_codon:yes gene_type:complete
LDKTLTDTDLTLLVQEKNDEVALGELISRHSGIYVDMLKKFGYNSLSFNQISDIMQDKDYVIYKAALEYKPEKAKFSTHLANKTKYMCLTQKTKNKKNSRLVSFEEREEERNISHKDKSKTPDENCIFNDSFKRILNLIFKHRDSRLQTIFKERYFEGKGCKLKPWKLVAEKVNLSAQGCINIHDKAIKEIKSKIENEKIKL